MRRLGLTRGLGLRGRLLGGVSLPAIQLSASSILESATSGSTVGVLSVSGETGYAFAETADPDNKFVVSGTNLNTNAALDFETATSHSVTIEATKAASPTLTRTFIINVTNVLEAATLGTLALDDSSITVDVAATVNITGASAGSTITGTVPAGMTLNSGARTITGTPSTIASNSLTLTETLADSPNSPRVTSGLTLNVVEAAAAPSAPVLTKTSAAGVAPMSWSSQYTNVQAGDTIQLRWEINNVPGAGESYVLTEGDLINASEGTLTISWPVFAATTFANNDAVEVWEFIERGAAASPISNVLTDTVVGASVPTWQFIQTPTSQGGGTSFTFNNIEFGNGLAVLAMSCGAFSTASMVPVGGGATINFATTAGSVGNASRMVQAAVTAGNYNITITTSSSQDFCAFTALTGTGLNSAVSDVSIYGGGNQGDSVTGTSTLIVPANGLGIAAMYVQKSFTDGNWTNGTKVGHVVNGSNRTHSAGTYAAGTSFTPTYTRTGGLGGLGYVTLGAAAWGPA